jgi:hypothetical protein
VRSVQNFEGDEIAVDEVLASQKSFGLALYRVAPAVYEFQSLLPLVMSGRGRGKHSRSGACRWGATPVSDCEASNGKKRA